MSAEFGTRLDMQLTRAASIDTEERARDFAKPIDRLLFLQEVQAARETGHDYVCSECGCAMSLDGSDELHDTRCRHYSEAAYR